MAFSPSLFLLGVPSNPGFIAAGGDAPVVTSDGGGATADVSVNTGDTAVTTVTADGTGTEVFSIAGGAEAGMFTINPASGALAFATTSVDGEYAVTVQATNDWGSDMQAITVTVEVGFHVDAVHFDGVNTQLRNAALSCTDGSVVSFSRWFKMAVAQTDVYVWVVDTANGVTYGQLRDVTSYTEEFYWDAGIANHLQIITSVGASVDMWYHLLGTIKTDLSAGNKIAKLYLNDVDVTDIAADAGASFNAAFNGLEFILGDGGPGAPGLVADVAEFWFAVNQSLLTGSDIPEATRRKFIDAAGKPVDLGADGSTPTGTAPTIFFSGDETAFLTNRGTGGAFTLTGTLTNASTSPSD